VVDGDSLWSISRFYDVWIQDIIRINKVKKFASGIPIIGLGSILKIPDYSNDDSYKYYCQIDNFTINLSAEFNTRQLFKQCEKILSKSLDFDLINQSTPDEKFWNVFLIDKRYPIYFLNQFFSTWFGQKGLDDEEYLRIQRVLLESLVRGDLTTLQVFESENMHSYELLSSLEDALPYSGISSLDGALRKFHGMHYKPETEDLIYNFIRANWKETHNNYTKYINADLSEISDNFKADFYRYMIRSMVFQRDTNIHSMMQHSINFLNERVDDGPLISRSILDLYSTLIWENMALGNYQLADSVSIDLVDRLNIEATTDDFVEILMRFDRNSLLKWEVEIFTNDIFVLTANMFNLNANFYSERYDYEQDQAFVEIGSQQNELNYLDDGIYYQLLQEHATRMATDNLCNEAAIAYEQSRVFFSNFEQEMNAEYENYNYQFDTGDYLPVLSIARCFYNQKLYDQSLQYLNLFEEILQSTLSINDVYLASANALRGLIAINKEDLSEAEKLIKTVNVNALDLNNRVLELSFLTSPIIFKDYINDYIEIYSLIISDSILESNLSLNPMELLVLQERVLANKALESLKIDSTKKSTQKLLSQIEENKNKITLTQNDLSENFITKTNLKLEKLQERNEILTTKLFKGNTRLNSFLNPDSSGVKNIIKSLSVDEVIFTYVLGSTSSKLLINSHDDEQILAIPYSAPYINSQIRLLRESMSFDKDIKFNFEAAVALYEILILPAQNHLDTISTIYLYGSEMESLPFGILLEDYDPSIESQRQKFISANWLIKTFSFARIFPITNNKKNIIFDNSFMGFANPSSFQELDLPKLKGAKEEVQYLALASGADIENIYFDEMATKDILIDNLEESYERIVFATHSLPAGWQGISSESSLVMASADGDFLLTPSEIINLDLETDIVLLSSCNSEQGGVNSIYKAFLVAGSNSVIYSNWELETTSAKKITEKLFSNMLFNSLPKHLALQNASIEALNDYSDKDFSHPAFWGNFSIAYRNL